MYFTIQYDSNTLRTLFDFYKLSPKGSLHEGRAKAVEAFRKLRGWRLNK